MIHKLSSKYGFMTSAVPSRLYMSLQ